MPVGRAVRRGAPLLQQRLRHPLRAAHHEDRLPTPTGMFYVLLLLVISRQKEYCPGDGYSPISEAVRLIRKPSGNLALVMFMLIRLRISILLHKLFGF